MDMLNGELRRLENEKIPKASIDKIKEFLTYLKSREELSDKRLYFYSNYLRTIARTMGNEFVNPSDQDIEKALMVQRTRDGKRGKLSEWSIEGYKQAVKKFYSWMGKPEVVAWIKRNNRPNYKVKPDFTISQEEVDLLIASCNNARDKAIFSLLYDTGIRIGEMLSLRIKDVQFDEYGMRLLVTGKTGTRRVRATGDSVGYLRAWLNVHPDQFNDDAWLFCKIGHETSGKSNLKEQLEGGQVYRVFHRVRERAIELGFPKSKRVNPHKFRHNRASQLAPKISESILEKQMGWVPSSKMTRVYVHLNDEDSDYAILEAQGIRPERKPIEVRKTKTCLNCKTPNPYMSKYCLQCGRPLEYEENEILNRKIELAADRLEKTGALGETEKVLISSLKENPELEAELLLAILKGLKKNGKLEELKKSMND
jgi:integrase